MVHLGDVISCQLHFEHNNNKVQYIFRFRLYVNLIKSFKTESFSHKKEEKISLKML